MNAKPPHELMRLVRGGLAKGVFTLLRPIWSQSAMIG